MKKSVSAQTVKPVRFGDFGDTYDIQNIFIFCLIPPYLQYGLIAYSIGIRLSFDYSSTDLDYSPIEKQTHDKTL